MANRAVRGETRSNMVRVRRSSKVGLMAGVTRCRRVGVVVVDVALRAGQRRMHTRQGIIRVLGVIEVDGRPVRCCVARIAGRGEARGRMIRICRAVPIRLMASETCGRQCRVVVIRMALGTARRGMGTRQREHRRVIEA